MYEYTVRSYKNQWDAETTMNKMATEEKLGEDYVTITLTLKKEMG